MVRSMVMAGAVVVVMGSVVVVECAEPTGDLQALEVVLVDASPSVVMAEHTNGSNLVCLALPEGLVFVDTGLSTRVAVAFRRAMEARFERPAMMLVLTHAHLDHILGMGAFTDLPVVASTGARAEFEKQLALNFADDEVIAAYARIFPTLPGEVGDARLAMPTVWVEAPTLIGGGKDAITVQPVSGHAAGCLAVEWAGQGVVVAGDLVQSRKRPYFGDPDTDLEGWIGELDRWLELGFEQVCPGHGPVIPGAELEPIRAFFRATLAHAAELKARGVTIQEAVADDGFPTGYWPADDPTPPWWPYCLGRAYLLAGDPSAE
jgi:glyoxylase-like metal-dependent hydrolase (beta-lactamase superfamily II)